MRQGSKTKQGGFTLIELMIVVAILGILITVAIPSMRDLIEENRISGYTNEFLSSVWLARSEAIKRSKRVTICRSSNGTTCPSGGAGWEKGWVVFEDEDSNNTFVESEVIQRHQALANSITMTGEADKTTDYLSFVSNGTAKKKNNNAQSGDIDIDLNGKTRTIKLYSVGRVAAIK